MAVYLLHLDSPLPPLNRNAHYIGWAKDIDNRVKHHANGTSKARFMEVAHERNIGFQVARIWLDGDKTFERKLKSRKNAPQLCPVCNGKGTVS